tara:strand:- start:728 stop:865 length:138 start_codon:yes stop_codon:yes gene_type:complete
MLHGLLLLLLHAAVDASAAWAACCMLVLVLLLLHAAVDASARRVA